jgi:hypothetical protein
MALREVAVLKQRLAAAMRVARSRSRAVRDYLPHADDEDTDHSATEPILLRPAPAAPTVAVSSTAADSMRNRAATTNGSVSHDDKGSSASARAATGSARQPALLSCLRPTSAPAVATVLPSAGARARPAAAAPPALPARPASGGLARAGAALRSARAAREAAAAAALAAAAPRSNAIVRPAQGSVTGPRAAGGDTEAELRCPARPPPCPLTPQPHPPTPPQGEHKVRATGEDGGREVEAKERERRREGERR